MIKFHYDDSVNNVGLNKITINDNFDKIDDMLQILKSSLNGLINNYMCLYGDNDKDYIDYEAEQNLNTIARYNLLGDNSNINVEAIIDNKDISFNISIFDFENLTEKEILL